MAARKIKLVCLMKGLYRVDDGGNVVVARQFARRGEPAHWELRFTNFFSERVIRRFPTLAEARRFLEEW